MAFWSLFPSLFLCGDNIFKGSIIDTINQLFPQNIEYPTYKQVNTPDYYYPKTISDRYQDMINNADVINPHATKEAYIKGDVNVRNDLLLFKGEVLAGLDLPVWVSNFPLNAGDIEDRKDIIKIIFLSQDPRRSFAEMGPHHDCISLSSPFGWHDIEWRSDGKTGTLPIICAKILNALRLQNKDAVFYFTDIYKFRRVDLKKGYQAVKKKDEVIDTSIDNNNIATYNNIFNQELNILKPNLIICIGNEAATALLGINGYTHSSKTNNGDFFNVSSGLKYNGRDVLICAHPTGGPGTQIIINRAKLNPTEKEEDLYIRIITDKLKLMGLI